MNKASVLAPRGVPRWLFFRIGSTVTARRRRLGKGMPPPKHVPSWQMPTRPARPVAPFSPFQTLDISADGVVPARSSLD